MPLTNSGRDCIADAIIGGSSFTKFGASAYLGVGDSSTAFAATQNDLQGANKYRKALDSGYPTRSANVITWRATFGTTEANFAWNEAGVFNSSSGGQMLCRKVQSFGTKTSGAVWILTYELTLSV